MKNKFKLASNKLSILWHWFIPSFTETSTEHQRESHLLNQITQLFLQLTTIFLLMIVLFPNFLITRGTFTLLAITLALIILFSVFIINRLGHYYLAVSVLFVSVHILIYYNASISSEPHLEIMYLIVLPLISILILDLRNTIILTSITLMTFAIFQYTHASNVPKEISDDLSVLMTIISILVILVSHWRNKIEKETQLLFLEQEKSNLIRDLIANISHDLKTPLTIINSSLYLIENSPDADKKQGYINKIKKQVWRLETYIQDMLAIMRLEDKQAHHQEWVNLNEIVATIHNEFIGDFEIKNISVALNLDDTISDLYTHKNDIYRMIQNLIKNAINYTCDNGKIQIATYENANNVHIMIKDTGIGMSQEDTKLIFDRFYRADKARSLSTGGTGLGLAIVKRIVDINNGNISVDSDLNKGTAFTVTLPIQAHKKRE